MAKKNMKAPVSPNASGPARKALGPKNMGGTLRRLLGYMGNSKLYIIGVVLTLLVTTGTSMVGVYFMKPLINDYIVPNDMAGLIRAVIIMAGIFAVGLVASFIQGRLNIIVAQRTTNILRKELFNKMQSLPLKVFDTNAHGELMSRFTNDVDSIQSMLEQSITQLLSSVLSFAGTILMMVVLSPSLFIITAVVIGLMVFISTRLGKSSHKHFQAQQHLLGELNGVIEENIGGLKEIKVFSHEQRSQQDFNAINEQFRKTAAKATFMGGVVIPTMINLNSVCYAFTAVFGGVFTLMGLFDVGSLAAFLVYSRQIGQPINQVSMLMVGVMSAMAGAERVFALMDEQPEVDEGNVVLVRARKLAEDQWQQLDDEDLSEDAIWAWRVPWEQGIGYIPLKGDVRFDAVTFGYDAKKTVLKNISLYAKPGQTIAFVGSTGAGKTTITNLINRFYDIQEGIITYDGIDVKDIQKDSLRRSLGMVLQDTHLFTGTVMDNIRYGKLNATDEQCIAAAKRTGAHSFIKRLPEGYHTHISGDGGNLSQGQRQLLAIARAVVADPPVMILDEATSSIDTRTEHLVQRGMTELMRGRTVFVIAHRLSTVRMSNAIMVLENGEIIERGSHDGLLDQKGRYYRLYTGTQELT